MTVPDRFRLTSQLAILKEVTIDYQGKTIDNIIQQMEYTIITINNIDSLVGLQELVGKFIIGINLYLPEQIESIIDSTIVIYDGYIE